MCIRDRCRLSLSTCKGIKLSIKTLNRLFVLTARKTVLDRAGLEQDLELLQALPFSQEKMCIRDSFSTSSVWLCWVGI